jgi:hypothetical protein
MTDREVEQARVRVARMALDARLCAIAALILTVAAAELDRVGAAMLAGCLTAAAMLTLRALVRATQRRGLVELLALDPTAYAIDAVMRYGLRAARPQQRRILAARLEQITTNAAEMPLVAERVVAYEPEIRELTRCLLAPGVGLSGPAAVTCRRLLTRCAESALYNRRIPAEDLGAALRRISAGVN